MKSSVMSSCPIEVALGNIPEEQPFLRLKKTSCRANNHPSPLTWTPSWPGAVIGLSESCVVARAQHATVGIIRTKDVRYLLCVPEVVLSVEDQDPTSEE